MIDQIKLTPVFERYIHLLCEVVQSINTSRGPFCIDQVPFCGIRNCKCETRDSSTSKQGRTNRTTSECTVTSDLSDLQEKDGHSTPKEDLADQSITSQNDTCANQSVTDNINQSESNKLKKDSCVDSTETNPTDSEEKEEEITVTAEMLEDAEEDEGIEEDEEDDDDDDDGWITPSNITSLKQKMVSQDHEKVAVTVGCVTTDFAMQNVLIQMGLNVISVEGLLIRRAKSFVFRCFACMKITKDMMKEFCPYCGNNTLQKVSMTVEDDGSIRYFLSRRKPISTKGMKYQLPIPRGGKHSDNPVLVEDQPRPQQRAAKKKQHLDVFDPDFVVGQSPFALNDISSRSAQLGIRNNQFNKRRQNANRHGRRK